MKRKLKHVLSVLSISLTSLTAQTNSVALKDASNTLINSYNSITSAYAAIPSTITQGYIIEISSAYNGSSETYPILFTAKSGASAANTITLRPALGVTSQTIETSIAVAGSGVLKLDDADYIVIDGRPGGLGTTNALYFNNLSTAANGNTIVFMNGACFNTVRNCNINNSTTSGTGRNVFLAASASNTLGNSDNLFKYNNITGGRYQFNSNGTAANSNTRNQIFGCNFRNGTFASFWGQAGTAKVTIDSCSFSCTQPTGSGLFFGIVFDSQKDSAIIKNNRMYDLQDASVGILRYIHVRSLAANNPNFTDIRNNFFSMMTGNAALVDISMIELEGTAANARIAHNSFRVGGAQTAAGTSGAVSSSALLISSTSSLSTYEIKNNLFVNERSGGTGVQHVALHVINVNPTLTINDNIYNSTSGNLVRWATNIYTTLSAYQATVTGGEPGANTTAVPYISANNLHLPCSVWSNTLFMAPPTPGIVADIDGHLRSTTLTYRGADELTGPNTAVVSANSGSVCSGSLFTITPSGSANSYSVSGGSMVVSPSVTTSYTVTGYLTSGCENTAVATVSVVQGPSVTISGTPGLCLGNSYTFSPSGALSYSYSGGNNVVSPTSNTTYTITGYDASACQSTIAVTVSVNTLPTVAVNNGSVCAGTVFTIIPTGAVNYTYSNGSNTVIPTANTSYTVTGADAIGCQNTAVSTVTVAALPLITVNSGSVCAGGLFSIVPTGAINYTYSTVSNTVIPLANESYTITGEDANGCQNTALSSVTVNALPVVSVNSGTLCLGLTFTIQPSGAVNYSYSSGSNTLSPLTNTTFTVTGADANGCENTAVGSVTTVALPTITVNGGAICTGKSFTMVPSGANSYSYSGGTNVVSPATTTNYTVSGTAVNGCINTALCTVTVNPLPLVSVSVSSTFVCINSGTMTLTGTPSGGSYNGTGVTGNVFSPATAGTFAPVYSYTNAQTGCENTASTSITVDGCAGIARVLPGAVVLVYPNPGSGEFTIELANTNEKTIRVTDLAGKLVLEETTTTAKLNVNLTSFENGVYFVTIQSAASKDVVKLIKQ